MSKNDSEAEEEVTENETKELEVLLQKIFEERGMDFREYKRASLKRRIQKRLEANNLTSYAEYIKLMDSSPDEYAKLFDTLLINVTEFFRDPEAFEVLEKEVIPQIISRKKKGDSIRIWSAGCASGEEPYSMGILLAEKLGESIYDYEIRIYATDIDENALIEARSGIYNESKLKNIKKEFIGKYFTRENGSYRISKIIRQRVIFGRQNLTKDAPISHLDLIVCRNVLIYFNHDLQNKLMMRFHYALDRDGYIFFGKSESMLMGSKLFKPLDKKWRIFKKSPDITAGLTVGEGQRAALEENLIDKAIRDARREFRVMDFYIQSIIQNISLSLIVIDRNNLITMWNQASEGLWLIKAENAIGRNFFETGMGERLAGIKERIDEVTRERINVRIEALEVIGYKGEKRFMDLTLVPLIDPNRELHGVIITSSDVTEDKKRKDELEKSNEEFKLLNEKLETANEELRSSDEELETANEELKSANEELETTIEELQSTSEELETSNEELQATNEELETTNEELRSTNEELDTTNEELRSTAEQLNSINMYNKTIVQSMNQSLIVLNRNGIITTWNPAAELLWGLKEEDTVGKSIFSFSPELGIKVEVLRQKIRQVVENRTTYREGALEHVVPSGEKRLMELTITPLIDIMDKPVGTVILSQDVTEEKRAEAIIQEARLYAESVVETIREPLLILDAQLRVKTANQAFYKNFNISPEEIENKFIYNLGKGQWDIPRLRELLEEILPKNSQFQDFEIEHEFPSIGRKIMSLNARRIYREGTGTQMILLAIEDITERRCGERS
ncbi:CheR family methyltransferase [Candidatus Methanoperedens nitratireducens]|uniref:protein-glutamate O-methyltransferase n=1 Tax=Candidatus Methanoperedens nitratireducens TaxID=1392998 RepID=A0A284VU66_9EURY|nr:CheR family methyltransferase [Candidatus Methanoperedens nitroreducens]SNQ62830.1 putative MCP methyltransferase, CheR-type [Candidatus Methanoperedens nitroreducens]